MIYSNNNNSKRATQCPRLAPLWGLGSSVANVHPRTP
jgi:hypothetical protein